MKGFKNVLVALAALATATALPQGEGEAEATSAEATSTRCVVPLVIYSSLPNPFTISVLPGPRFPSAGAWPLQVTPRDPSRQTPSRPIISRTRIRQPEFRLTNGRLTLNGFPAQTYPTTLIFPPPLVTWVFGGQGGGLSPATFTASYTCDAEGNTFLRLRTEDGVADPGFAVKQLSEGQQVFIRPRGNRDRVIPVELRANTRP